MLPLKEALRWAWELRTIFANLIALNDFKTKQISKKQKQQQQQKTLIVL